MQGTGRVKIGLLALLLLVPLASASVLANAPGSDGATGAKPAKAAIQWLGYDEGLARAKETGKPLLINFWADWCHYCRRMKAETYADSAVVAAVNADFIPVSINTTTDQRRAAEFFVRGLPTIWFVASDGATRITNLPGYVEAPMFLEVLRYLATRSYETMDFKTFLEKGA